MRRTLIGAVAAAALVAGSLPAADAASRTRVDGDHFSASGLRADSRGCLDPGASPASAPTFTIAKGPKTPPLGNRSIGWKPAEPGYGIGPVVHVDSPSSITTLGISVYAPDDVASGQAVVTYVAPGTSGVWKGAYALGTDNSSGWHGVNAATSSFQWRHYTDGAADQDAGTASIASFVAAHGGDGDGAWVGFVYGCDGNPFYLDALQVEATATDRTFDLQGYGTRTTLGVGPKSRTRTTVPFGRSVDVKAALRALVGGDGRSGRLLVESRPLSESRWHRLDKVKVGRRGSTVKVHPTTSQAYRATYAGTTAWEKSRSAVLKVQVRKKVAASFADVSVTKGDTFTASGRVQPAKAGPVLLQRYLKGKWRTFRKGRSDGGGHFRLAYTAKSLGKSYWRVLAPSGGGTVAGHSDTLRLNTSAPPQPPSGGGGGTPPPTDPPPDDPPPPTGPHRGAW